MRVSTVRLALLMGVALALGWGVGATPPTGPTASIRQAGEDTRDGGYLTPGMIQRLLLESPGTDVNACRYHDTGKSTVITCNDGTYLEWI